MRRSDLMLAFLGSVALHAGLLGAIPSTGSKMAGGAEQAAVDLGAAFEDMVTGAITAADTPVTRAEAAFAKVQTARATTVPPEETAQATPVNEQTRRHTSPEVRAAQTTEVARAVMPDRMASSVVTALSEAPEMELERAEAARAAPAPPSPPEEMIEGRDIAVTPVEKSLRPAARPAPSKKGNASRQAKKGGTSSNRDGAQSTGAERAIAAQQAGNAAADNYPGAVMRTIRQVPQVRVRGKGRVVLVFTINGQGRLANLSVRHSSGDPKIDREALAHLRRAAPFPQPPPGARQRFSVPITYR